MTGSCDLIGLIGDKVYLGHIITETSTDVIHHTYQSTIRKSMRKCDIIKSNMTPHHLHWHPLYHQHTKNHQTVFYPLYLATQNRPITLYQSSCHQSDTPTRVSLKFQSKLKPYRWPCLCLCLKSQSLCLSFILDLDAVIRIPGCLWGKKQKQTLDIPTVYHKRWSDTQDYLAQGYLE